MVRRDLAENPLVTHADVLRACEDVLRPVMRRFEADGSGFNLGDTGAHYKERTIRLEGYARFLLGAAPCLRAGGSVVDVGLLRRGLAAGTDPGHPSYWGDPARDYQLMISMAGVALALLLIPEALLDGQPEPVRRNVAAWLGGTNTNRILENNQVLFRVITNTCLRRIGAAEFSDAKLRECFACIDRMDVGGGCFTDGIGQGPVDYYNSWVMHWGALIFCAFADDGYADLQRQSRERARLFGPRFRHWYARDGAALPHGRSLTYRAAQNAFWAGCILADEPAIPWGQMKGLFLRNMRWWLRQPIFSDGGLPLIGYAYPNLKMSEQYNSPNSPLYTLNPFLALAVPPEHPFWQAAEEPLEKEATHAMPEAGMILHEDEACGRQVVALNNGQGYSGYPCLHYEEKYEKFAYSSHFGFCVNTGNTGLEQMAADNVLLLSEDGDHYHHKRLSRDWEVRPEAMSSRWSPFPGVEVRSWLIPMFPWHVRVHEIDAGRELSCAEGSFPLRRDDDLYDRLASLSECGDGLAAVWSVGGFCGIAAYATGLRGEIVLSVPNANLLHPNVVIPVLRGRLPRGRSRLVCACLGHPDRDEGLRLWRRRPDAAGIEARIAAAGSSGGMGSVLCGRTLRTASLPA